MRSWTRGEVREALDLLRLIEARLFAIQAILLAEAAGPEDSLGSGEELEAAQKRLKKTKAPPLSHVGNKEDFEPWLV